MKANLLILVAWFLALILVVPIHVRAHCDTLDGPVVSEAKVALDTGNVTPVLKWVRKDDEQEIKAIFQKVVAARKASPQAGEIADRYFFETLVRIHRAGEGAPYTGLQAGPPEPVIAEADKALQTGSVEAMTRHLNAAAAAGIKKRFNETLERKKHAAESVDAGRDFVAAYVDFTHYVERLYNDAVAQADGHASHASEAAKSGLQHEHK